MAKMASYGLVADIAEDGSISVNGHNESYMAPTLFAAGNSNLVETLFDSWNFTNCYTSNDLTIPEPVVQAITRETRLSNIAEETFIPGNITVVKDGVQTNISLSADETVGSFIDQLEQFGFDGVINDNGQIIIRGTGNSSLRTPTSDASNILSIMGINSASWINTNNYESGSLNVVTTNTFNAHATDTTKLSLLGVTTGEYFIYNNGVKYSAFI